MDDPFPRVIHSTSEASERLISHGCSAEGLYLQGVVIEAARTESDVNQILEEIVPHIPKLEETEESRDLIRTFRKLITSMLMSRTPAAALKALRVGTSLNLTARGIQLESSMLTRLNLPENVVVGETDLSLVFSKVGEAFLECGRPEDVTFLREVTQFSKKSQKEPFPITVRSLESIPYRDMPAFPIDIIDQLTIMANDLALAERHQSAVSLCVFASGLNTQSRGANRVEQMIESLSFDDVTRTDAEVCSHLMKKGYPAEATDFFRLALDVPSSVPSAWVQIWNILQNKLPGREPYPHKGISTSKKGYKRFNPISPPTSPAVESTRVAENVLSRYMPELTDVVLNRLDAGRRLEQEGLRQQQERLRIKDPRLDAVRNEFERLTEEHLRIDEERLRSDADRQNAERTSRDTSLKSESPSPRRQVNAWLEEALQPLIVGRNYRLGVNIGSPRADSLVGVGFKEPEWGTRNEIGLVIAIHARSARIEPLWHQATLLRKGEMEAVYFNIVPIEEGVIELYLTIFLARELTLLEEFRFTLLSTSGVLDESPAN